MNHCDRDGCTALMLSSGTSSEDVEGNCVDYLLKHKADPTLRDNRGLCSVHYAAAAGNTEALIHLLDNCKYSELAELGQQQRGRGQPMYSTTPVHLAAANGHKEALLTLLSRHKHSNSLGT